MQRIRRILDILSGLIHAKRKGQQTLEELRAERDYTAQIIQGTPSLVVGIAPDGVTRFVNVAVENVSGYSKDELIGKNWWKTFYPGDEYAQVEKLFQDFEKGPVRDYEMTLTTKNGEKRIVAWNSLNRFNGKGELVEVIGFGNDMTARKLAENELKAQQAISAASTKMSALGEMAAGIAHEINTPLATISLTAGQIQDMIETQEIDLEFLKGAADMIEATSLRISKIVKALKTFSRNAEQDPYSSVALSSIIEDTLTLCQEKLKHRSIKLIVQPIPESLKIQCQFVHISQVLLNLLNNAVDAVETLPEKWIRLEHCDQNQHVEIFVTDSGPGIPKPLVDKIMDPFFTTKEIGKGTGLGLSISKGIIESHRGQLHIDVQNPNTRFVIRLPKNPKNLSNQV